MPKSFSTPRFRHGWTLWHFVSAAVLAGLGALVTGDAWADIFRIAYKDEEASHIFLVPIIAVWLIWIRRRRLRQCRPVGTFIGPCVVALGWLCYWFGDAHGMLVFWHIGAVVVVVGCLLSVLGSDMLLQFFPAFAVLVFLVPMPGRLRQAVAAPLGEYTALITQQVFDVMGIPVQRSGNLLSINNVPVTIAEACNGLRMVYALTMVSYVFAFATPLRLYVRVLVVLASPVSAILCNVIRLVPTLWVYGHMSPAHATQFHDISGWVMLPVSFLLLMGILQLLRWAMVPITPFPLAYE